MGSLQMAHWVGCHEHLMLRSMLDSYTDAKLRDVQGGVKATCERDDSRSLRRAAQCKAFQGLQWIEQLHTSTRAIGKSSPMTSPLGCRLLTSLRASASSCSSVGLLRWRDCIILHKQDTSCVHEGDPLSCVSLLLIWRNCAIWQAAQQTLNIFSPPCKQHTVSSFLLLGSRSLQRRHSFCGFCHRRHTMSRSHP